MHSERTIYEFDEFRVDTGQFLLVKAGRSIPITPTVFRILLVLLERAGEIVTKEDLMTSVWPDCFVEAGNLNRNVSTLRKALDETPSDHRYIETISKAGYRFVAPVRSMRYPLAPGGRKIVNPSVHQIVGRDSERASLRQAYDRARQGHGGIVCVSGDAGLGKTALVDVFIDDLARDGHICHIARGRCSESFTEGEAFLPWIEALSELANEAAISDVMQKTAPSWHREISHTGSGSARKMKRELVDFCKQMAATHPLIILIDDFHWADIGSVDLLSFLATRLESTRTVVIICYRPVEIKIKNHPFLHVRSELLGRDGFTEITLPFLSREDIREHLGARSSDTQYSDDYTALLHAKTEGNPLFLREMIRGTAEVSDFVKNMIRARLDQLDDTHRQLLVTASVQGREFDSAVLSASMQLSPQDVEEALHDLDEVYGLVQRIREEQLPDGRFTVRYRFVYALCQEACCASLAPTRRASLNASLAEAFLAYYGN